MSVAIDFNQIRALPASQSDSFEDLACELFRRFASVPPTSTFHRLRGSGGDGGVEAYFQTVGLTVHGLQAKYFFRLGDSELRQIERSLKTAQQNYPHLREYLIYVPFNLTGKVAGGARGRSEQDRFQEWKDAEESKAKRLRRPLEIRLVQEDEIVRQLVQVDPDGGWRRYWFGKETLTRKIISQCLQNAEAFAGPRYTASLDVVTAAHETLDTFGGTHSLKSWIERNLAPQIRELRSAAKHSSRSQVFGILEKSESDKAIALLESAADLVAAVGGGPREPNLVVGAVHALRGLVPIINDASQKHYEAFCVKHGAEKDTPSFRQFMAEYMVSFPAEDLDRARDLAKLIDTLLQLFDAPVFQAALAQTLLMIGPAGIGKTHSLVSSAKRRLDVDAWSLVLFGEDFGVQEAWEVVRSKLGFGAQIGRDELFGCLQAASYQTGFPFLLVVDALNETPGATRWKRRLPELIAQLKNFPEIKLCVSARDSYRDLVIDQTFPGYAFEGVGFAGREFLALQAFCEHYDIKAEITPLFAEELTNPLFLQLACKATKAQGKNELDLSMPGFVGLFETYMETCAAAIRGRLNLSTPHNFVRSSMLGLAEEAIGSRETQIPRNKALQQIAQELDDGALAGKVMAELASEGLLILNEIERDVWVVRFSFQRYFDILRALCIVEQCTNGGLDTAKLEAAISAVPATDPGLLEALAIVLPSSIKWEIWDDAFRIDKQAAYKAFVSSLPMRARETIGATVGLGINAALDQAGLWPDVLESVIKISLVPDHRFNANYLHRFLSRIDLASRDPYWLSVLYKSYEGKRVVKSIVEVALTGVISRWPLESKRLILVVLSWFCAAADRRIRDRASKALSRILVRQPALASDLVRRFAGIDDDFVKERILLAIYSSRLLNAHDSGVFVEALEAILEGGYDSPNVVIRDAVRLIGESFDLRTIPTNLRDALARYPTRIEPLSRWPTKNDVTPMTSIEHLPFNMDLFSGLAPDFARYIVEPALRHFDLEEAALSKDNAFAWIMLEALNLGYPGRNNNCLGYDHDIRHRYGSGRGKPGFAETIGKKYYWTALHRLMGILSDTAPMGEDWDKQEFRRDRYWSRDLRDVDLTDFRDVDTDLTYPSELLGAIRYDFKSAVPNDLRWVSHIHDVTDHTACMRRRDKAGTEWIALRFSAEDSEREDTEREDTENLGYRRIALYCDAVFSASNLASDHLARRGKLDGPFQTQSNSDYRGFLAEYPFSPIFAQADDERDLFATYESDGLEFTLSHVDLLRGNNWEYDYSWDGDHLGLTVPAPQLIRALGLRWDLHSGWLDQDGRIVIVWLTDKFRNGLYILRDALDQYLDATKLVLISRRFVTKSRLAMSSATPHAEHVSYLRYRKQFRAFYAASKVF